MSNSNKISNNCVEVANILKAISHPQRLNLLCLLSEKELSVSEILSQCQISQSQLSQFLKRLSLENILTQRREGNYIFYAIKDTRVKELIKLLHQVF